MGGRSEDVWFYPEFNREVDFLWLTQDPRKWELMHGFL